ncbi:hypothetical protein AMTRI_Chr06g174450 [Amborella trichopoda]
MNLFMICFGLTLQINNSRFTEDLEQSWEVLAEPIQTVMRRYGVPEPYEKLKELTRGRAVTKESMQEFVRGLQLPQEALSTLLNLTPHTYIGAARDLAINKYAPTVSKGASAIHALEPQHSGSCIGCFGTEDTTLQQ